LEYKTFCKRKVFDVVKGDLKNVNNPLKNVQMKTKIG